MPKPKHLAWLLAVIVVAAAVFGWRELELRRNIGRLLYSYEARAEICCSSIGAQGQALLLDKDGRLSRVDPQGAELWSIDTPFREQLSAQMLEAANGRIYICGGAMKCLCLDQQGRTLWLSAFDSSWERSPQPPEQGKTAELLLNDGWNRLIGLDSEGAVCWSRESLRHCSGGDMHLTAGLPTLAFSTCTDAERAVLQIGPGGELLAELEAPGNVFGGWTRDAQGNSYLVACDVAPKCGLIDGAWLLSYAPDAALRWQQQLALSDVGAFFDGAGPCYLPGPELLFAMRDGGGVFCIDTAGTLRWEHAEVGYLGFMEPFDADSFIYSAGVMRPPQSLEGFWPRLTHPWAVILDSKGAAISRSLAGRRLLGAAHDTSRRVVLASGRRIECRQW